MVDLATAGQLLQERGLLAFEVMPIPRKPASSAELRAKREKQLAGLDQRIDMLGPLPPELSPLGGEAEGSEG